MKFLILSLALVAVVSAQQYGQQHAQHQPIAILRQAQDISPDGTYNYSYETENGIAASENGGPGPVGPEGESGTNAAGQYQYTAPDGTPISVTYVADNDGFKPQGAHLPVAPAIPPQIQRALEWIAAHPEKSTEYKQPQKYGGRF